MNIKPFRKAKRTTPDEFQAQYDEQFRKALRAHLPWIVMGPLALVLGMLFVAISQGVTIGAQAIIMLIVTYGALVYPGWAIFIGPWHPRRDEGEITRKILDIGDHWERKEHREKL